MRTTLKSGMHAELDRMEKQIVYWDIEIGLREGKRMLNALWLKSLKILLEKKKTVNVQMRIMNGKCFLCDFRIYNLNVCSDFNYVPDAEGKECILSGPELIPQGSCQRPGDTYIGSSGYRKVPGNTCISKGEAKDAPKRKSCAEGEVGAGQVSHQRHDFDALVLDHIYFKRSHTILVHLSDKSVWQSHNEGFYLESS